MGLKSEILGADGKVNPSEGKVKQEGRLDWRKLSLVFGNGTNDTFVHSLWMIVKGN